MHGGACALLLLAFRRGKKAKTHTKQAPLPPYYTRRRRSPHAANTCYPSDPAICVDSIHLILCALNSADMILLPPSRYPPLVNIGESALSLYTRLCSDVVTWAVAIILVYQMYSAVELTGSTLLVIDHAAKIIETLVTYPQLLVALSATRWPERFGYTEQQLLSHIFCGTTVGSK